MPSTRCRRLSCFISKPVHFRTWSDLIKNELSPLSQRTTEMHQPGCDAWSPSPSSMEASRIGAHHRYRPRPVSTGAGSNLEVRSFRSRKSRSHLFRRSAMSDFNAQPPPLRRVGFWKRQGDLSGEINFYLSDEGNLQDSPRVIPQRPVYVAPQWHGESLRHLRAACPLFLSVHSRPSPRGTR
jgi:hypothetical protein